MTGWWRTKKMEVVELEALCFMEYVFSVVGAVGRI